MSDLCRHFGRCGGCAFQDMPPVEYLERKRDTVRRALARHGLDEIRVEEPVQIHPGTRRRASLKALRHGSEVSLGFHGARSHLIVDMEECRVLLPRLVRLLPALRNLARDLLEEGEEANVAMTACENGIDLLLYGAGARRCSTMPRLAEWARRTGVTRVSANGDLKVNFETPRIRLADIDVELPADSFLQPTREGEHLMQELVRNSLQGATCIVDLFAGCGTFSFALARGARVHAVDSNANALAALLAAARKAAKLRPVTTETRDLSKRPLTARELDSFDAAVLDPPRAGALAQAKALAASNIGRIAYASCDAATFARDARILVDGGYRLASVHPVDQFVWSSHIELAATFSRR